MMAIAALLATASSVNATLYASGGLTTMLADVGQFPPFFGREIRLGPHAGMLITAAIVLVVSNLVDLSAIASVGSACSLRDLPARRHRRVPAAGRDRLAGVIVLSRSRPRRSCSSSSPSTRCATRPRRSRRSSRSQRSPCSSTSSGSAGAATNFGRQAEVRQRGTWVGQTRRDDLQPACRQGASRGPSLEEVVA